MLTPSSVAHLFLDRKKTDQSSFYTTVQTSVYLKCSKVSRCRKTGSYSPYSHLTTNSAGELPSRSKHRHWESFHTTLDILRHGQTQTQPQLQHMHTLTHTHCSINQMHKSTEMQMGKHKLNSRGVHI